MRRVGRPARALHPGLRGADRRRDAGRARSSATRRCSTRAASSRSCGATTPATRPRWSSGSAASRASSSSQVAETLIAQLGPRAHDGARLRRRLDAALRRRADDPRRRDPAAAARQHRPARAAASWRMRGHASIQGSSDIPTLYDLLPGYLPMPRGARGRARRSRTTSTTGGADRGWWSHFDNYIVSLLKAWFGDAATAENDYGFGHLPKISRQPLALPDDAARARRRARRPVRDGPEPGRRLAARRPAAPRARAPEVARRARPRRDRDRHASGRTRPRSARASCARRTSTPRSS